jgi:Arc/MetJ-type ribon-helix-helix transcriptional regulator
MPCRGWEGWPGGLLAVTRLLWLIITSLGMKIELTPETQEYIEQTIRSGAFASPSDFLENATRRQMQEESWFEEKVLEGLKGEVTPLTEKDLASVRAIARKARAGKAA